MGRRIRVQDEDAVYFVTNRCFQQRFYFRPSARVNAIILGCLAWAAERHKVRIYGFVFMSNHFHMLLSAPLLNLSEFMCDFQGQLARRLNHVHGREGSFFHDRFKMEHVIDEEAQLDKLVYTHMNPVNSLLVRHPERWPGVNSWSAQMGDGRVEGRFILKKELHKLRREDPDLTEEEARKRYTFKLAKLPALADSSDEEYRQELRELVDGKSAEIARLVDASGTDFLGAEKIKRQSWRRRPSNPKRTPQPLCHCRCPKRRKEHKEWLYRVWDSYKKAMGAFHKRGRRTMPTFPRGTYPPGRLKCVGA